MEIIDSLLSDWSLIMGRGEGEHVEFYPYEKVCRKSFSHAEGGGGTTSVGVVFMQ